MYVRFSPMLATGARTMVPTLIVFSLFALVVGHDLPGGGFAGGLLGAAAVLLVYLAFGDRGVRRALRVDPEVIVGLGLAVSCAAGALGLFAGDAFLEALSFGVDLPVLGSMKLTSVLVFDTGVYLVVVGLIGTAIVRFGAEERT